MPPVKKKNKQAAAASSSTSSMSARAVGVSHAILTGVFSIDGTSPLSCVLAEYLHIKDIGSLDTAVCNIFLRPLYLDAMRHLMRRAIFIDSIEITQWILLRGIKIKELSFYDSLENKDLNNSLVMMAEASYGLYESIRKLYLREKEVDIAILIYVLSQCKNLEHLEFAGDNIFLNHFKLLAPVFKKLKYLDMNLLNFTSENFYSSCVKFLSSNCTALETLVLYNYKSDLLDDSALLSISNGLSSLTCLEFFNYDDQRFYVFSEAALTSLKGLKMLKELQLDSIPNLTTPVLMDICHNCDKIVDLDLNSMPGLTNLSFESLVQLEYLYLENVPATDATIQSIATHCSKLEYLGLVNLTEITDIAIDYIANGVCQSLKTLDLTGCKRVKTLPQKINAVSIETVKKVILRIED
jgi:hypothetical protein